MVLLIREMKNKSGKKEKKRFGTGKTLVFGVAF